MQVAAAAPSPTPYPTAHEGRPVLTIDGVNKPANETAPMRVFARAQLGRFTGYGSLATAISAARNISRGEDRSAVLVERRTDGIYELRDIVWQYFWGRNDPPRDSAPMRHFHFEDGSFSAYTARMGNRVIPVTAREYFRSWDDQTRWLVDGKRVFEVTPQGGAGR